jgi:hypothetical protein
MEPSDDVLARLDRIGALDRSGAAPGELLAELRELIRAAEACTGERRDAGPETGGEARRKPAHEADDETGEVVGRLRAALARDIIG